MIDFYFPTSSGEWWAFGSATATIIFGLLLLVMPRLSLRILRLQTLENVPSAVSQIRATMAGFYLGTGFCCIFLAQPFLYFALGVSWLMVACARIISMMVDRGHTRYNWIIWPIEALSGIIPILYALNYI